MTPSLDYLVERTVVIGAPRGLVFSYFTDSERFARWWGAGSTIECRVGGAYVILYPNGSMARGEITELDPERQIRFTWGYEGPQAAMVAPGDSLVTITLSDVPEGTLLKVRHALASEALREAHRQGWRFHLSQFAHVATQEQHAQAGQRVEEYFSAWNQADSEARQKALATAVTDDVAFQSAYGVLSGRDELLEHIAASHVHMPGIRLENRGNLRQAFTSAVVDWAAVTPDGQAVMSGLNLMELAADGRIARVVSVVG